MSHRYEDYSGGALPWLDRPGAAQAIDQKLAAGTISEAQAILLQQWTSRGYVILKSILDPSIASRINREIDQLVETHSAEPLEIRKQRLNNAFDASPSTCEALVVPELLELLDLLLGKRMLPHQTLNLPVSSQQAAHSDQILMSTHPAGYMAAVWFALEDIDDECGPLIVFPGSHRWPYVSASAMGIPAGASPAECDAVYDANYYAAIEANTTKSQIEPFEFTPSCGDLLIWHSNLVHGARLITRSGASRRSLIAHYLAEGVEHYSDLYGHAVSSRDLRPSGV